MNKKFQILLGLMVMFSLLLAACGPAEEDGGDLGDLGATDIFGEVTEEPFGTPLPGTGADETEVMETPLATEMVETTEATVEPTEEMEATPAGTATTESGLPGTGMAVGVSRLSEIMDAEVVDEASEPIGTVSDMVIDLCAEDVQWVSIDGAAEVFGDRTNPILVPFDALSWNAAVDGGDGFFMMTTDSASVEGAPDLSLDEIDFNDQTWASEWETFWSGQGIQLDMNGEMVVCEFAAAGTGAEMGDETGTPAADTPAATETGGTPAAGTGTETGGTPAVVATGMNVGISDQGLVLASNLMGMSVEGLNGENIGEIEEILVSMDGAMTDAGDEMGTAEPTDSAGGTGTQETGTPDAGATPTTSEDDDSDADATETSTSDATSGMAAQDGQGGALRYLVIGAGGFLGIGENNIAVPATALSYNAANNSLVLNIDESQLETAPTVDLENLEDTTWQNEVDTFWMDYEVR